MQASEEKLAFEKKLSRAQENLEIDKYLCCGKVMIIQDKNEMPI